MYGQFTITVVKGLWVAESNFARYEAESKAKLFYILDHLDN